MGLPQMLNSKKSLVILVIVELIACVVLGIMVFNKQTDVKRSEALITTMIDESNKQQKTVTDYENLTKQLQSLKMSISTMAMASGQPMNTPDQICSTVKLVLYKQQQVISTAAAEVAAARAAAMTASSPTAELDFLVTLVAKEITQQGAVDTQQTEKFAVVLYHMQKVLDAVGYKLNDTIKTTNLAVMKFQTDNQLKADGKIGSKSWAKVRELWNTKRPGGPMPAPAAAAPAPTKPQTPGAAQTKPKSPTSSAPVKPQSLAPAASKPSLSSVTTKSSVRP
jgi:hypothetical protein